MSEQTKYDISEAEARDRAARENLDSIGSLFPAPNEDRPTWIGRVFRAVAAWWRKPRSRIGLLLLCVAALCQGCATAAWHNYNVAEAEAFERAELEAGRIPLVKTNGQIVQENLWGYVGAVALDGLMGYAVYKLVKPDDDGDTVNNTTVNHNYPPEPEAEPEAGE